MNTTNQIIKNLDNNGDDINKAKQVYFNSIQEHIKFLMLDLNSLEYRYRHNFLDIINI